MKTFEEGIKSFKKKVLTCVIFLIVCSIAHGNIILTLNGEDPALLPLELETTKSMIMGLSDSESTGPSYDLTLSITGGVFLCEDPASESSGKCVHEETVEIQTSDLSTIGDIYFEIQGDHGVANISVTTNQPLAIGDQTVSEGAEIYQLILFNIPDEKIVVFGVNCESLNQQVEITPSLETGTSGLMDSAGESMMESMESQQFEYTSFANPAECPDLDDDNFVNLKDFAIFSGNWLANGSGLAGDFNEDGTVDIDDLAQLTTYWLHEVCAVTYVNGSVGASGDGSSWASAYKYLQEALGNVQSGDEIWAAKGTYYPDNDRTSAFQLIEGVALYGGFDPDGVDDEWIGRDPDANMTVLSGDIDKNGMLDSGNSYHVVVGADEATIDGFKITGGFADANSGSDNCGGGIFNDGVSTAVNNCILENNLALFGGAAYNDQSSASFVYCKFTNNVATLYGGAISNYACDSVLIRNCLFDYNTASNSLDDGRGGAIFNQSSTGTNVINCTFHDNLGLLVGGAICEYASNGTQIRNSIFWNNLSSNGPELAFVADGGSGYTSSIFYSDVQGGDENIYGETGYSLTYDNNIDTHPLFANAANGDFHLKSAAGRWDGTDWVVVDTVTSPCIDAGDSSAYDNEPLPNGGIINMGFYGNTSQASKHDRFLNIWVRKTYNGVSDGTEEKPYKTIEQGISSVRANGRVHVVDCGYYYERLSFDSSWSKPFTLKGEEGQAVINGEQAGSVMSFIDVPVTITLDNIGVFNGKYDGGGGIYIYQSSPIFIDCDIVSNQAYSSNEFLDVYGGGIYVDGGQPIFWNCVINANSANHALGTKEGRGGGLYTYNSQALFYYCDFGPEYPWNSAEEDISEEMYLYTASATPSFYYCTTRGNPGLSSTKCTHYPNAPYVEN